MDNRQSVLIVEDELINRNILKKMLSEDYDILEAENGEKAWEILTEKSHDIGAVLLDINMPVMDGYAILRKMQQAVMTELPVIVMTAEADIESEQKALDNGAWDFVTKPYNPRILRSRLRNAIARRQVNVYMQMQRMAAHDSLTGLHNRARVFDKVRKMIDEHPDVRYIFLRADIDHFALYNAAFGEEEGDNLLCYLAGILTELSAPYGEHCAYGRMNADVFVCCIPYSGDEQNLSRTIDLIQNRLAEYSKHYRLEISVGAYVIEEPSLSVEEFYIRASIGAQKCKRQYGSHLGFYDEESRKQASQEIAITNEMEHALEDGQFVVYLQPKTSLETDRAMGAEALVRWKHPDKGLISPGLFIPVFERNGFIGKLDYHVWEATCRMLRDWIDAGIDPMPVSVNISRISLYNPQLVEDLVNLVRAYGLSFDLLQLEITESAYMTSPELMQEMVHNLREAGFTILMDDFGSGYSSLNTLKDMEVDILKIDMKFLPVGRDVQKGEIILASIIKMANWLGMAVVVEGVETKEQRDFLEGTGCESVQGYFYARPMPRIDYEREYVYARQSEKAVWRTEEEQEDGQPTFLVIDDIEIDRMIITRMLSEKYHVHSCKSAEEGLAYLKNHYKKVQLILIDNMMPGMSGMDFLAFCQDDVNYRLIPQIMITASDNIRSQVQAFQGGVYDYITKPLIREVVEARIAHVLEICRQYREFERTELTNRSQEDLDQETGLLNRAAFREISERYMKKFPDDRVAMLMIKLNDFDAIRARYGDDKCRVLLQHVAEVLTKEFRKSDIIGHFGDEEFLVLMSGLKHNVGARRKASEILRAIGITCARAEQVNVDVGIGISYRESEDTIHTLFGRADMALYEAEHDGKGNIVVYGEQIPPIQDDDKPLVLICGEDPQLYPTIALAYGDSAAFANITTTEELQKIFQQYSSRIRLICLDMQKKKDADAQAFTHSVVQYSEDKHVPVLAVIHEGDMKQLREALKLDFQDFITLPPQMDAIQRRLSRVILGESVQ